MSDGPFRGLNLNKAWKDFVKRADNEAFSSKEVSEAVPPALQKMWQQEVSKEFMSRLKDLLKPDQYQMFGSDVEYALNKISTECMNSSLETILMDCAVNEAAKNGITDKTLITVCEEALKDRASREMRRVEEHCYREGYEITGKNVRARMQEGFENTNFQAIAESVSDKNKSASFTKIIKKIDLDEGVPL